LTYFSLSTLNSSLHSTSSIVAGYYPTLAQPLAATNRILSTFYEKKKKHEKALAEKKGEKISEALFFS